MAADGDAVIMRWLWEGTHKAEIAGFRPSGKTITMSGATTYVFDQDNRLNGHCQIRENLAIAAQQSAPAVKETLRFLRLVFSREHDRPLPH